MIDASRSQRVGDDRRVVVTGMGLVTPLGIGKAAFADRLFSGACGICPATRFDTTALPSHLAAEARDFEPRDFVTVNALRRMDRLSLMTVAAARLAFEDAGITIDERNRDRTGIILGTAFGPTDVTTQLVEALVTKGPLFVKPIIVPNSVLNAPAGHASIELGFRGVNTTVTQYAASAELALIHAVSEIRRGTVDCILAGGGDILSPFYYQALTRFRALSPVDCGPEGCRPFDRTRNGAVAGEGCALLCLESRRSALEKGRRIYGEITGVGMGASPTTPTGWPTDPAGITRTLRRTLANAGLAADDLHIVSAAANGSLVLDATEAAAYVEFFAAAQTSPRIAALKGALGESYSGGGMRACALVLSLAGGVVPPTIGLTDPLLPPAFVRDAPAPVAARHGLLAGISFGGTYAFLIFSHDFPEGD